MAPSFTDLASLFLLFSFVSASSQMPLPRSLLAQNELLSDLSSYVLSLPSDALPVLISSSTTSPSGSQYHGNNSSTTSTSNSSTTSSGSSSCEATYGVLPCTDTVIGNLFLLAAYGYLMYVAASMLSQGSELLLSAVDAGLIGGLLLPILGALPDSILILVSGLGGTQAEAQEQVLVGIGLLAGSIVMLLTLLWGSCLILGRCDFEVEDGKTICRDKELSKPFGLTDTGVENDNLTMFSARFMILSIIPFIVAQLPSIFNFSTDGNIPVLIACLLSLGGLVAYCLYQAFTPWMQERRRLIALKRVSKLLAIDKLVRHSGAQEKLVAANGDLNLDVAKRLFDAADKNGDFSISCNELRVMLSVSLPRGQGHEDLIENLMSDFDEDKNREVSWEEFQNGMQKWCRELKLKGGKPIGKHIADVESYIAELIAVEEDNGGNGIPTRAQIIWKAILLLLGGTIVAAVFADPLVDAVNDFSSASDIPSFFISFVLLPLASNSSESVSSIMFSARKKKDSMSLTYSQIYGGVTVNSTLGLGIFLAVVYGRQLVWDFSSEVLVICLVTVVMGLLASFRKVFPLWMAGLALIMYPLSLGLVAILDYVAGWQ